MKPKSNANWHVLVEFANWSKTMEKRRVYLDNNATTPLHPEVKKLLQQHLDTYGNPSSMHELGRETKALLVEARENVANFLNASPDEIIFTSCGTEADNMVLNTIKHQTLAGKSILTTVIEHPAILEMAKHLQAQGTKVELIKVDKDGKVDLDHFKSLLNKDVGIVSVIMVNNEIGTIQDIKAIAKLAHEHGALMHTDAVQAMGKFPIDVKDLDVDYLSLSGHKIYAPKGIGALYVKAKAPLVPLMYGGHQEQERRPGTENILGIIALSKAISMRAEEMTAEAARLTELKAMLKQGITENIPDVYFNGDLTDSVPNTLSVSFAGAEGESILLYLDFEGIAISTGSACASGSLDPSHVLMALGLPIEYAHGSVRISMGRETTKQDIEYVLYILPGVIKKIRDMSTIYRSKS